MKAAQILRQKLASDQHVLGTLTMTHLWLDVVEMSKKAGLDYLIVDREHHPQPSEMVAAVCTVGRLLDFPVLIRPPDTSTNTIRLAMDAGPVGLLLPMVEDTEQLDAVRDGIYLPPRGERRPGGPGNQWVSHINFEYEAWKTHVEDHLIIVPQVESPRGLENAEAIAAHPIVTALGVGPYDLSTRLGAAFDPTHPKMVDAFATLRHAAKAVNKPAWRIGDGAALTEEGYRFICIGDPMVLMAMAIKEKVEAIRQK